jgi:hypothetical protein
MPLTDDLLSQGHNTFHTMSTTEDSFLPRSKRGVSFSKRRRMSRAGQRYVNTKLQLIGNCLATRGEVRQGTRRMRRRCRVCDSANSGIPCGARPRTQQSAIKCMTIDEAECDPRRTRATTHSRKSAVLYLAEDWLASNNSCQRRKAVEAVGALIHAGAAHNKSTLEKHR